MVCHSSNATLGEREHRKWVLGGSVVKQLTRDMVGKGYVFMDSFFLVLSYIKIYLLIIYRIALIFHGSLILRISRVWNRLRN